MIIGNNNINNNPFKNQENNFNNRLNTIKEEAQKNHNIIKPFSNSTNQKYYDVNNKNDMYDKSFAMLQDRLNNGLISLDEFNKKCNQLHKLRQK